MVILEIEILNVIFQDEQRKMIPVKIGKMTPSSEVGRIKWIVSQLTDKSTK